MTNRKKFSFLLASRKRPELLKNMALSVAKTATNPNDVEILVGVDEDDHDTKRIDFSDVKVHTRLFTRLRSKWLHRDYINWVFTYSSGKYLIVVNDDVELVEHGWDVKAYEKLEKYLEDKPDRVVYGSTLDDTGDKRCCCFPLFSREAACAAGWVMPDERPNWGADNDVRVIYDKVGRTFYVPEIKINHLSHHNNYRAQDQVSHEVSASFAENPGTIDHEQYANRIKKYIANHCFSQRQLLVIYNICGISGKENQKFYLPAIHNILDQKFPDFHVCISGCMNSETTKKTLMKSFGDSVSYNWIDEVLPLNVTFNHSVRKCFDKLGPFEAVVYVDSGINFAHDNHVLSKLWQRHCTNKYGIISTLCNTDHGFDLWGLTWPSGKDLIVPMGKACNLHCSLFPKLLYDSFGGRILPDIFASDTSESIFSFMCASVGKKWCITHDVLLSHKTSLDGPSSGFRHKHPLLYKSNKSLETLCKEGLRVGFGYEECIPVLIHDHNWYDGEGNHKDPELLKKFIWESCYFQDGDNFYKNIKGSFHCDEERPVLSSPAMSCILVSHNKPKFMIEAIESVMSQSWPDWELIIVDSGELYDNGFFNFINDYRVKIVRSIETEFIRNNKAMAPWCFNRELSNIKGQLVTYLCDDDIFYPNAFETFVNFAIKFPHAKAMYASQDMVSIFSTGERIRTGERRATERRGSSVYGQPLDCQVDYLQFCHRKSALDLLNGPEYWPESKHSANHADGLFMEKIGAMTPIYSIDVKVSQNRRTPLSTYDPVK